ncbi:dimethylargininase [Glaciihabitans sp. dw_435]|uniref:dimethylargininase n=1 Tax=Glaciihabitans sp. dw_435 TaxID=2720081 RepID=UPI001BD26AB9|nr:dimethylargininase [Glaciihabitans sp. dw_435]
MTTRVPMLRRLTAALVSAFAVAAATYLTTIIIFVPLSIATQSTLSAFSDYFLPTALVFFILSAIAAAVSVYWRWWTALVGAIIVTVLAILVGSTYTFVTAGNAFSGEVVKAVFGTLIAENFVFGILGVVATITLGRYVYRRVIAVPGAPVVTGRTPKIQPVAFVRSPASTLADGELTHLDRVPVDVELADAQWEKYVSVLEGEGFRIIEVEAADSHPDSVFIEDTVVILGRTAVITSPGAESRRGEPAAVETDVARHGLAVARISLPGTLDGGDVLKVGTTVYVGRGGRTNAEGIRQFRAIAGPLGFTVVAVPVSRVLHLKSAVTALPDGTVIGHAPLVEHPALFERFLAVPEESGAAVVVLSDDAVLMSASAPLTAVLFEDLGYRVVTVDISEFEKLEGCVTCLSVRVRG